MPPRTKRPSIQRILFPTDFSGASIHAAGYALSLAEKYRAGLRVVHVIETSREARGFYLPHLSFDKLDEEMRESAKDMLRKFVETRFKGVAGVETDLLEGEPYKEILKQVRVVDPDIVVMGTFGKARVDRFVFGSTTERVMRRSPCPVLVVPPPR